MDITFTDKRALVTGGGRGFGRDIVQRLVDFGATVFVIDRLQENLASLKAQNPSITTFCVDITDWDLTRKAVADIGTLDLLVNNAGVLETAPFIETTKEQLYNVTSVNFLAAFNIAQVAATGMIAHGNGGAIVNVASAGSKRAFESHSAYCCSKAAVAMLTKTMACELGRYNIRVNSVGPTLVITDLTKEAYSDPDVQTAVKAKMPLERLTEKEDVVNTIIFLLSDKARNITGSMIPVDGGMLSSVIL